MEVIILGRKAMSPISLHSGYVNTVMSPLSRMRIHVFQNTEDVPHPSAIMPLQTQLESQGGGRTYLTEILVEDPFSARRGKFRSRLSRRQFSQLKFHFSECFEISMIGMFLHRSIFKRYSCCIILVMISQMFDEISAR